jgi:transcriptional regulator with XRE-family HTH domain
MLCEKNNISIAALERECGLGNATIKKWATSTPSGDRLSKVADYFNVSVDFLLGREDNKNDLNSVYFSLAKEAQENGIDPDDIRLTLETIKRLRGGK